MKQSSLPIVFAILAFVAASSVAEEPTRPIADSIRPPAGRLAIVADGNSPDPDDIGAMAVMFALLHASDLRERLVHLSHSCDLKPTARIPADDELRRQRVLHQLCKDGVAQFGPFKNLADYFNCRTHQPAAVNDLRDAINKSSKSDPLWIIEAGEPDIIGYALQAAEPAQRRHVHVVSHHPANDNTGDFFSWQQILDFGVHEHQIGDQNVGLKTDISRWDWAKDHSEPRMKWIWKQFAYAEQDGVVKFQKGKFDCSDAGMVYWWMTGASDGGNKHATPADIAAMLRRVQPVALRDMKTLSTLLAFTIRRPCFPGSCRPIRTSSHRRHTRFLRRSSDLNRYEPERGEDWSAAMQRFKVLTKQYSPNQCRFPYEQHAEHDSSSR